MAIAKNTVCLWYDNEAEAAARFYAATFPDNTVRPHSSLGNKTPAEARRTLEQFERSAPGALAKPETDDYQNQTRRLSS